MDYVITTESGFEQMYEEYFPKIYNHIFYRLLSREDTEDVVSEVFIKVAKPVPKALQKTSLCFS